jgi:penicillin-binding protein 1A
VKEAVIAVKLERRYSKSQILGFYLNTAYLGRGAYGVEAAARAYFNKHARDLTLSEAAYLAGILPAPEAWQPESNPKGAIERRNRVLELMRQQGYITELQERRASRGKVKVARDSGGLNNNQRAAYFMEWLRRAVLQPEFGNCLYTCGLKIYTTLDLEMQHQAEDSISSTLTEKDDPQAALVSMTPAGEIRAMVGGRNFDSVRAARGFNYATDYPGRQPGSSFKPFTLLTAIEEGISPLSRFNGASPQTIEDPACPGYEVNNYGDEQFGYITLDEATTNSVNTVYAQLAAEVGPENVARTLDEFGFDRGGKRKIEPYCSLALGTLDVTPLEQARAYAAFAAGGELPKVEAVRYVENARGRCLKKYVPVKGLNCDRAEPSQPVRVADENSVAILDQTLTHVVQGGTATAANIGRPVAGKTGTTQDYKDAWFAGYTPQLATVVWMGYPVEKVKGEEVQPLMQACYDPAVCRPVHGISVTGGSFPAIMWAKFMSQALAGVPVETFPYPTVLPGTIINPPAPSPSPTTKEPSPTPTVTNSPTPSPTQSSPSPSPTTPSPSPTTPSPSPTRTSPLPRESPSAQSSGSPSPSPSPTSSPTSPESSARLPRGGAHGAGGP